MVIDQGRSFSRTKTSALAFSILFLFLFTFHSCFEREYTNGLFHAMVGFFSLFSWLLQIFTQSTLVSDTPSSHAMFVYLYSFTIFVNLTDYYNTVTG